MSALRVGHGVYVDPWTRMEVYGPDPLPVYPEEPIYRRKATPEELARLDGDAPRQMPAYPTPAERAAVKANRERSRAGAEANRQLAIARHSDVAIIAALRDTGGNISAAAERLGMSCSGLWRRVDALRRAGRMPDDLPTGRAVQFAARRPRGTVRVLA